MPDDIQPATVVLSDASHSSTPVDMTSDPTHALLKIVHGDVDNIHIPHKSVITGKKIRNSTLRQFVEKMRSANKLTDSKLLDVIMTFDESVEKELLTEEILEKIRRDPDVIKKYLAESD